MQANNGRNTPKKGGGGKKPAQKGGDPGGGGPPGDDRGGFESFDPQRRLHELSQMGKGRISSIFGCFVVAALMGMFLAYPTRSENPNDLLEVDKFNREMFVEAVMESHKTNPKTFVKHIIDTNGGKTSGAEAAKRALGEVFDCLQHLSLSEDLRIVMSGCYLLKNKERCVEIRSKYGLNHVFNPLIEICKEKKSAAHYLFPSGDDLDKTLAELKLVFDFFNTVEDGSLPLSVAKKGEEFVSQIVALNRKYKDVLAVKKDSKAGTRAASIGRMMASPRPQAHPRDGDPVPGPAAGTVGGNPRARLSVRFSDPPVVETEVVAAGNSADDSASVVAGKPSGKTKKSTSAKAKTTDVMEIIDPTGSDNPEELSDEAKNILLHADKPFVWSKKRKESNPSIHAWCVKAKAELATEKRKSKRDAARVTKSSDAVTESEPSGNSKSNKGRTSDDGNRGSSSSDGSDSSSEDDSSSSDGSGGDDRKQADGDEAGEDGQEEDDEVDEEEDSRSDGEEYGEPRYFKLADSDSLHEMRPRLNKKGLSRFGRNVLFIRAQSDDSTLPEEWPEVTENLELSYVLSDDFDKRRLYTDPGLEGVDVIVMEDDSVQQISVFVNPPGERGNLSGLLLFTDPVDAGSSSSNDEVTEDFYCMCCRHSFKKNRKGETMRSIEPVSYINLDHHFALHTTYCAACVKKMEHSPHVRADDYLTFCSGPDCSCAYGCDCMPVLECYDNGDVKSDDGVPSILYFCYHCLGDFIKDFKFTYYADMRQSDKKRHIESIAKQTNKLKEYAARNMRECDANRGENENLGNADYAARRRELLNENRKRLRREREAAVARAVAGTPNYDSLSVREQMRIRTSARREVRLDSDGALARARVTYFPSFPDIESPAAAEVKMAEAAVERNADIASTLVGGETANAAAERAAAEKASKEAAAKAAAERAAAEKASKEAAEKAAAEKAAKEAAEKAAAEKAAKEAADKAAAERAAAKTAADAKAASEKAAKEASVPEIIDYAYVRGSSLRRYRLESEEDFERYSKLMKYYFEHIDWVDNLLRFIHRSDTTGITNDENAALCRIEQALGIVPDENDVDSQSLCADGSQMDSSQFNCTASKADKSRYVLRMRAVLEKMTSNVVKEFLKRVEKLKKLKVKSLREAELAKMKQADLLYTTNLARAVFWDLFDAKNEAKEAREAEERRKAEEREAEERRKAEEREAEERRKAEEERAWRELAKTWREMYTRYSANASTQIHEDIGASIQAEDPGNVRVARTVAPDVQSAPPPESAIPTRPAVPSQMGAFAGAIPGNSTMDSDDGIDVNDINGTLYGFGCGGVRMDSSQE